MSQHACSTDDSYFGSTDSRSGVVFNTGVSCLSRKPGLTNYLANHIYLVFRYTSPFIMYLSFSHEEAQSICSAETKVVRANTNILSWMLRYLASPGSHSTGFHIKMSFTLEQSPSFFSLRPPEII